MQHIDALPETFPGLGLNVAIWLLLVSDVQPVRIHPGIRIILPHLTATQQKSLPQNLHDGGDHGLRHAPATAATTTPGTSGFDDWTPVVLHKYHHQQSCSCYSALVCFRHNRNIKDNKSKGQKRTHCVWQMHTLL